MENNTYGGNGMNISFSGSRLHGDVRDINSHNINLSVTGSVQGGISIHSDPSRTATADWVSSIDFNWHQAQAYEKYAAGTLLWLLDSPIFTTWINDEAGRMLWCPGKPGAGKTTFAAFVVDYLQKRGAVVCYIYCRFSTTFTILQLFEAILKQLILHGRIDLNSIQSIDVAKLRGSRLTLDDILTILQTIFTTFPNIFIMIDALDECFSEEVRHLLLRKLRSFTSVKIMITSRPLPSIESQMNGILRLEIFAGGRDIRTYIHTKTLANPRLGRLVQQISSVDLEAEVIGKADGMFLLVAVHMTNLAKQTNANALLHALEHLSTDVTKTYASTMERIAQLDEVSKQRAFHTLSWVSRAVRPLTLTELRYAIAIGILQRPVSEEDLDDEETILSVCAGMITVDKNTQQVGFLHYTVQEYLIQIRDGPDFLPELQMALVCMKLVSWHESQLQNLLGGYLYTIPEALAWDSYSQDHPLLGYATMAWGPLVQCLEENETIIAMAVQQLSSPAQVRAIGRVQSRHFRLYGGSALHLVAESGLATICNALLVKHTEFALEDAINSQDRDGRTPLMRAAGNGHRAMVNILLNNHNIAVNKRDRDGWTALSWAVIQGHLEVVKILLQNRNTDVDAGDLSGRTPLLLAALYRHYDIVKILLENPIVNPSSRDRYRCTPLYLAAAHGQSEVVKMLLEVPNIRINARDGAFGQTPLSRAAEDGHLEVVKILLNVQGLDVNVLDDLGETALSMAARTGKSAVVRVLIDTPSVDLNARRPGVPTPLSLAAQRGHTEVVKLLSSNEKADVNVWDRNGQTALSLAAEEGHLEVVKVLLMNPKVNHDLADKFGRTPMLLANENKHWDVVQLLLNRSQLFPREVERRYAHLDM